MAASEAFTNSPPSPELTAFLTRIENADPNSFELDDDDKGASWGHYQFTAGSMTCTTVLSSWSCVGTTEVAHRLISAALWTCKVARHLCYVHGLTPGSYLSDIYLENVIDILLRLWKEAGGPIPKGKGKAIDPTSSVKAARPQNPSPVDTDTASMLSLPASTADSPPASSSVVDSPDDDAAAHGVIHALTKEEMAQWLLQHAAAAIPPKSRPKDEFVKAILSLPKHQQPSKKDADCFVQSRKAKKEARKSKGG